MLKQNEHCSVQVGLIYAALSLQVGCLQHTKYGFTAQVVKVSEASFIWIQKSLQMNGKRGWKFSGLLRLNLSVKANLIALGLLSVHLLVQKVSLAAFAMKATTGTPCLELA